MAKEKTLLEKTLIGLLTGAASLALVSCETTSSSQESQTPVMGKCYGVSCGGGCKGKDGSCKGKDGSCKGKDGSCKGKDGSCKGKDGSCKGKGKKKDNDAGCGADCGGKAEKDKKEYRMMTKEDCEKKGGRWEAP